MKQTIGYTRFSMSYNDMAIINMAIMENVKRNGSYIEIAGKPVYEFCPRSSKDAKKDILRFVRLAYARETFSVIDMVWNSMKMERAMINYPSFYWLSQISMVKKSIVCREVKERIDFMESTEYSLCLKNLLNNRMEKVLALWNAAFKSIGISYKNEMLTHKDMLRLRLWKEEAARLNYSRELTELQLSMCGVLHYHMQDKPFSEVIKMVEA